MRIKRFKSLQVHIEKKYPVEWEKICLNKMGMNKSQAKAANMEESMASGFLSKQNDALISNFRRKDKMVITMMVVFTILQMALAFLK